MNKFSFPTQQKGFTLLELIFSIGIGMIALVGVLRLTSFAALDSGRIAKEALYQESLAIANNRLANILKQMYTTPCGDLDEMIKNDAIALARNKQGTPSLIDGLTKELSTKPDSQHVIKELFPLEIGVAPPNKKISISGKPVTISDIIPGSDYFALLEVGEKLALSTGRNSVDSGRITLSSLPGVSSSTTKNKVFMITDCNKASIFRSAGGKGGSAVSSAVITVPKDYILNAKFNEINSIASQIKKYIVYVTKDGLRRRNLLTGHTEQIADDVVNMKIRWGLGNDRKLSVYLDSEVVSRDNSLINKVITAEITLTMPSGSGEKTRDSIQLVTLRNRTKR